MKKKNYYAIILFAIILCFLFGGCSGKDTNGTNSSVDSNNNVSNISNFSGNYSSVFVPSEGDSSLIQTIKKQNEKYNYPQIDNATNRWILNGELTNFEVTDKNGKLNEVTVGENGNWYVGKKDSGITANGAEKVNGKIPHKGADGHWYIGDTNMEKTASDENTGNKTGSSEENRYESDSSAIQNESKITIESSEKISQSKSEEISAQISNTETTVSAEPAQPDWGGTVELPIDYF